MQIMKATDYHQVRTDYPQTINNSPVILCSDPFEEHDNSEEQAVSGQPTQDTSSTTTQWLSDIQ